LLLSRQDGAEHRYEHHSDKCCKGDAIQMGLFVDHSIGHPLKVAIAQLSISCRARLLPGLMVNFDRRRLLLRFV
jgi:hypothetical protein